MNVKKCFKEEIEVINSTVSEITEENKLKEQQNADKCEEYRRKQRETTGKKNCQKPTKTNAEKKQPQADRRQAQQTLEQESAEKEPEPAELEEVCDDALCFDKIKNPEIFIEVPPLPGEICDPNNKNKTNRTGKTEQIVCRVQRKLPTNEICEGAAEKIKENEKKYSKENTDRGENHAACGLETIVTEEKIQDQVADTQQTNPFCNIQRKKEDIPPPPPPPPELELDPCEEYKKKQRMKACHNKYKH